MGKKHRFYEIHKQKKRTKNILLFMATGDDCKMFVNEKKSE